MNIPINTLGELLRQLESLKALQIIRDTRICYLRHLNGVQRNTITQLWESGHIREYADSFPGEPFAKRYTLTPKGQQYLVQLETMSLLLLGDNENSGDDIGMI